MSLQLVYVTHSFLSQEYQDQVVEQLTQETMVDVVIQPNSEAWEEDCRNSLPDLIVITYQSQLQTEELLQHFRARLTGHRPVIVVLGVDTDSDDRINLFLCGADDYLEPSLSASELGIRLLVHLRRNVETLTQLKTGLPTTALMARIVERVLHHQKPWAFLLIRLNHLAVYTEAYGQLPTEQIIRTLASLLKTSLTPPDLPGQVDDTIFMVLTTQEKAAYLANVLSQHWDEIAPSFYSERDQHQGYVTSPTLGGAGRHSLVNISIGVVTSQNKTLKTFRAVYAKAQESLHNINSLLKSHYAIETPKLSGQISTEQGTRRILLAEPDAALAFLLKSTLILEGYHVDVALALTEIKEKLNQNRYQLLILDPHLSDYDNGWDLTEWVCLNIQPRPYIVHVSSLHHKEKSLSSGANLYLPKPFELSQLFFALKQL
jgi:DNA-binding response OmpR family regulator